jgi:phosphoglucosamine mutase
MACAVANQEPMTSEMALKLGRAIAKVLHESKPSEQFRPYAAAVLRGKNGETDKHRFKILIGKDTRLSGICWRRRWLRASFPWAQTCCCGTLADAGMAFLTRSMRADAGVVISASHNPYQDNGIKFFSWDGFKLPTKSKRAWKQLIFGGELEESRPTASAIGKAFRISDAVGRYNVFLKNSFPRI